MACACGPSVNRTLTVELNIEKVILNFKLISSDKNDLEFNISLTLCLKIRKLLPRNPTHQRLLSSTKSSPKLI
jgi:hypothetical protein